MQHTSETVFTRKRQTSLGTDEHEDGNGETGMDDPAPTSPSASSSSLNLLHSAGYPYPVRIFPDRLTVVYTHSAMHQLDVGTVRSDRPLPGAHDVGVAYYELRVVSGGARRQVTIGIAALHSSCLYAPHGIGPGHSQLARKPSQASERDEELASLTCRQVGLDAVSYGYRAEDGHKYHVPLNAQQGNNNSRQTAASAGAAYGPSVEEGDVMGCGINYYDSTIFFTHNGRHLGTAFQLSPADWAALSACTRSRRSHGSTSICPSMPALYAAISLHSKGERVVLNFGQRPFSFDLLSYQSAELQRIQSSMTASQLDSQSAIMPLIRSYLMHMGYDKTLKALDNVNKDERERETLGDGVQEDVNMRDDEVKQQNGATPRGSQNGTATNSHHSSTSTSSSIASSSSPTHDSVALRTLSARQRIHDLIESGQVSSALTAISQLVPDLWHRPALDSLNSKQSIQHLKLRMHAMQFMQIITPQESSSSSSSRNMTDATRTMSEAIDFAQSTLSEYGESEDDSIRQRVNELMGVLAYAQPSNSPLATILTQAYREETADAVNSAILAALCTPSSAASSVHGLSSLHVIVRHAAAIDALTHQHQAIPIAIPNIIERNM